MNTIQSGGEKIIAIIPAAGYATRLYPLTLNRPKHLLEVNGKTILEHVIKKIEEIGVKKIFIVSNDKYFKSFVEWQKKFRPKSEIEVFNDNTTSNDDRLGQIGDILFAIEKGKIGDDLLIISGDNLFDFSLKPSQMFFLEKKSPVNCVRDAGNFVEGKNLGVPNVGNGNRIISFEEKPENPKTTFCSMGIYYIPKKFTGLFKNYLGAGNNPDKMGYFMAWMAENFELYAFPYKGKWFDIGLPESLEQARKEFNG